MLGRLIQSRAAETRELRHQRDTLQAALHQATREYRDAVADKARALDERDAARREIDRLHAELDVLTAEMDLMRSALLDRKRIIDDIVRAKDAVIREAGSLREENRSLRDRLQAAPAAARPAGVRHETSGYCSIVGQPGLVEGQ
jgi:chromosome segregation ATPase